MNFEEKFIHKIMKKNLILFFISYFLAINIYSQTGWFPQNSGTLFSLNSINCIDTSNAYVAGDNFKILKSSNGGNLWVSLFSGPYPLYSSYFLNISTGWVAGADGGIWKTTNGGVNFSQQQQISSNLFNAIRFIDNNVGYACGGNGTIVKSTNSGSTWFFQQSGVVSTLYSIHMIDTLTGYICGAGGRILNSINGGVNWTNQVSGTGDNLYSITFRNANTGFVTGGNQTGLILMTTNGGVNWLTQNSGTTNSLRTIFIAGDTAIYAGGINGTIIKTTNGGINWFSMVSGTGYNINKLYFLNNRTGYAVGDQGTILKTTDGGGLVGVEPVSRDVPGKFELYQNYPNPFNPSTIINYTLPVANYVELKVYDGMGKEVAALVSQNQIAGKYAVEWNAKQYSSGVYFYKLTVTAAAGSSTGDFIQTKRMVLVK
jgi:photosystem II stability/assembly factor-like uncharacterized protein